MPRRDEDDYDDDRDRDRPRQKSSNSTLWIVLGIILLLIVVGVVGCVGLVGLGLFRAGKAINETVQNIGSMTISESFLTDLSNGQTELAYQNMSQTYRAANTKAQFEAFLAKNPILTKHKSHSMISFNSKGDPPNQKMVVVYRLSTLGDLEMDPEEDPDNPPKPTKKPTTPTKKTGTTKTAEKAPAVQDSNVTLTLTNEGGVWKVESITVP